MVEISISSIQNPLLKHIRKLHHTKERKQQCSCLLEGTNLIAAACETDYPIETICATPTWHDRHLELWQTASSKAERSEILSDAALKSIATTVQPDGVVAVVPRLAIDPPPIPAQLTLALDRIQDPGNLGAIVRSAVAAGADGLWTSDDSVDLDSPKVLRASAGNWFKLSMGVSDNLAALVERYRSSGVQIVATTSHTKMSYWDIDLTVPSLILIGNEGAGLSPELLALADTQIEIPMSPQVESLNAAVASSLILYESLRQRSRSKST
jgi:RNA methyltransferase, TrmH family